MKKGRKRLFVALAASLVLLVTVPLMAAFAGEGYAPVSGSDVSGSDAGAVQKMAVASTVSETDAAAVEAVSETDAAAPQSDLVVRAAAPKIHLVDFTPEGWYGYLAFWWGNYNYLDSSEYSYAGYDASTNSIKFVAPECSNSMNTFLYWRDQQTGKVYYPGQTYSIKISDMEQCCVNEDGSTHSWYIKAIWQESVVAFETNAWIQYDIPTEDEDDYLEFDGFNRYYTERGTENAGVAKGTYNLKTGKTTYSSGYNKIQVSADYIPTYKNYTFVEWNTATDGTGKSYHPGDMIDLNEINNSGIILYGIFEGYTTKRVVRLSRSEWEMDFYETTYTTYNADGVIPQFTAPAALTNSKNTFVGWRNDKTDEVYTAGKTYYNLKVADVSETDEYSGFPVISLSAVWKGNELAFDTKASVWFSFDEGSRDYQVPVSGTVNLDTGVRKFNGDPSFTIPADSATDNHEGFRFIGWNTSEYGDGTMYQPGDVIHFNRLDGALGLGLYATYETDQKFKIVVEDTNVTNFVTEVEPTTSLVLMGDVDFDEVRMVVANVEGQNKEDVIQAVSEQVELKEIDGKPNVQMLDIKLVDSQNHGVTVESGKIKIMVDYPDIPHAKDYNYVIYHYKEGVAEPISVQKLDNCLVFFAESFSPYALVWSEDVIEDIDADDTDEPTQPAAPSAPQVPVETPKSGDSDSGNDSASVKTTGSAQTTESPSTGDNFSPVIFIVLLIVAAAAAGSVLVLRSRKSKDEEQADA